MKTDPVPESIEKINGRSLLIVAGVFLGMSFAGFFDGIVLHQILQWHHMVSSIRPTDSIEDLEANTFWDGVFLVGASILTALGLSLLWVAHKSDRLSYSTKTLVASLLFGAGAFNVVEGLIDHHLLGIHHVKSGSNQIFWDFGFLALSAIVAGIGLFFLRSHSQDSETQFKD
jgi:uncharacterized membrane protein